MHRIVVDAMGGDLAPDEIIKGAAEASLSLRGTEIILVGDSSELGRRLPKVRHDGARMRVHHAATFVEMDEKPGEALAAKPDSSIAVAADLVARGEGDALVSAGNTGASVLACARRWKLLPNVRRAALAAVYPTELRRGEKEDPFSLILDVGATIDAEADDLVGFAVMGAVYARLVSKNRRPRVALLSNGTEAGKGPPAIVAAHARLVSATELNFIGNIEGLDIPRGVADVVVTSGFVGNVVLKMLEGVSETVVRLARYAHKEKLAWRIGLMALSSAIEQLKQVTDWQQYGGAPLLGFAHPFIKAHGRSNARAITNAIKVAHKALTGDLCGNIEKGLAELEATRHKATPSPS
ncbi:MAG: phosphate acyltransferase PlsX [Myxococcales bacterium]|jgi:glycerol-3-phosphate acyltransferase PlsX|nr:phosphate acyltransferase PlsX [Myxococcales bacterium]HRC57373.1 phosphate acyltransferase PlsX [Kofleriaceae bacterium]